MSIANTVFESFLEAVFFSAVARIGGHVPWFSVEGIRIQMTPAQKPIWSQKWEE
jgi:hypothetical protein